MVEYYHFKETPYTPFIGNDTARGVARPWWVGQGYFVQISIAGKDSLAHDIKMVWDLLYSPPMEYVYNIQELGKRQYDGIWRVIRGVKNNIQRRYKWRSFDGSAISMCIVIHAEFGR